MHLSRTSRAGGGGVEGMSDRVGEVEEPWCLIWPGLCLVVDRDVAEMGNTRGGAHYIREEM